MLIVQKYDKSYQNKIESLLHLLIVYQKIHLSQEEKDKTTFIIAEDNNRGVYGGAILSQGLKWMPENIEKALITVEGEITWTARICFCIEEDPPFRSLQLLDLCEGFYKNLLKELAKLGNSQNIDLLLLQLLPADYFNTKQYGNWSYLYEFRPEKNAKGLFHGVLALKDVTCKTTKRVNHASEQLL